MDRTWLLIHLHIFMPMDLLVFFMVIKDRDDRMRVKYGNNNVNKDKNLHELLEYYNKSLEQFGKLKNGRMAAEILIKIGDVYKTLMNHEDAIENYSLALKLFQDEKDTLGEALTLKYIGNIWKMEKVYSEAREFYELSLKKFQLIKNLEMEQKVLKLISKCYQAEGAIEDAINIHKRINELPLNPTQGFINQINIRRLLNESSNLRPPKTQFLILIGYTIILILSELVTTYYLMSWGIVLQVFLITCLIIHSTLTNSIKYSYLLQAMILLPLIRIMSLTIPVTELNPLYWMLIMSIPIITAIWMLIQSQHIVREVIGLKIGNLPLQLLIGLTGLGFGLLEFLILQPTALVSSLNFTDVIFASSIIIFVTGFIEALVFRGIIQRNAENFMGKIWGIIFTAILFTSFNISWNSSLNLIFIFAVSLCYGYAFQKTHSILGISISQGLCNVILLVILPFFL